jgi:hypothetical protein
VSDVEGPAFTFNVSLQEMNSFQGGQGSSTARESKAVTERSSWWSACFIAHSNIQGLFYNPSFLIYLKHLLSYVFLSKVVGIKIRQDFLKGTVAPDFRLQVFCMN